MNEPRSTQDHARSIRWTPRLASCTRTIASTLVLAWPAFAWQSTTLVSLDASGGTVHAVCDGADMTPDGRFVLFFTPSTDMDPAIPPVSPMHGQLWIRDLATGQNELVSAAATGGYSTSFGGVFGNRPNVHTSADGRFVAFETNASDLVAGDTNAHGDVFVRDRLTGVTRMASLAADGSQLSESSAGTRVSDDGRYVLFSSRAVVVPGVAGGNEHLYRSDMSTPTTELVARYTYHGFDGEIGADMSADGNLVAFATFQQLLPVDTNAVLDVYVRDFTSGSLVLESAGQNGEAVGGIAPRLSADGGVVAFISSASNLVPGDTNGRNDIFVRDRATGVTRLATRHSNGTPIAPSADDLVEFFLSADGEHVAFYTRATNLIDADVNLDRWDVFVHDVETGETELSSVDSNGAQAPHSLDYPILARGISADGQRVLFDSVHSFTPDDTHGGRSVFLHDRTVPTPRGFCFGTVAACPCANAGAVGFGCQATNAMWGLRLSALGQASVAHDSFLLVAGPLTPGTSALLFQGTSRVNSGAGAIFGDGLRCAGGTTSRLGVKSSSTSDFLTFGGPAGDTPLSVRGGVSVTGGTLHYQIWFRNAADWCSPSTYNTSNGLTVTWIP